MKLVIEKKTDQLNYEDFLGGVTRTVTVAGIKKGTREQQYDLAIEGDKRFWRPPLTVLKLLAVAWGNETDEWIGRRATLYGDPEVSFGTEPVGGIRVSHLSHITEPLTVRLTVTRGKKKPVTVQPLMDTPIDTAAHIPDVTAQASKAVAYFAATFSVTQPELEAHVGRAMNEWTAADLDGLNTWRTELAQRQEAGQ